MIEETIVVWGTRIGDGLDAQRKLDRTSSGFGTAIELEAEYGARPAEALPEIVARTPGATVRSIGGLGQFSSVSLRGSSGQQVAIFLDGIPLGSGFGGVTNLADLPLDTLHAVELYRGYVPVTFGGATIGGAVNLVGRMYQGPTLLQGTSGWGSYQTREIRAFAATPISSTDSTAVRFGYSGSKGNFPFYDTNRTPLVTQDDKTSIRANNGYDRFLGQLRWDGIHSNWRYGLQQLFLWKRQGIPGILNATSTKLENLHLKTIASAKRSSAFLPGGTLWLLGGMGVHRRHFRDPKSEIGIANNDEETNSLDAYISPRLRLPLWKNGFVTASIDGRAEWIQVTNHNPVNPLSQAPSGDARRSRLSYGLATQVEQFLWKSRVVLAPAMRIDSLHSRFAVSEKMGEQDDQGQNSTQISVSPRLGIRLRLFPWLELRTSAGRYFRPPSLLELFGDQGFTVGNEGLTAEKGTTIDAGFVIDRTTNKRSGLYTQIAGFATWSSDLIQWIQAGPVIRPTNVAGARVYGTEMGLSAYGWHQRVQLQANYTYLRSRNHSSEVEQHNKPLPGRPKHNAFLRLSIGNVIRIDQTTVYPRFSYNMEYLSGNFLDPSGRLRVPKRVLHGLGAEITVGTVKIGAELRNLLDARTTTWTPPVRNAGTIPVPVSDFIGYPLPGRSFWLNATLRHQFASDSTQDKNRERTR